MIHIAMLALLAIAAQPAPADGEATPGFDVREGWCDAKSHIARGPIGSDLRRRHSPYACDIVVISKSETSKATMFQFGSRKAQDGAILAFAGRWASPYLLVVERVYLKPEHVSLPNGGYCRLWNGESRPGTLAQFTAVMCGAQVDQGKERTVPFVLFRVK